MKTTAQQITNQVEPIEHKQADATVIAGTSNGLLFLDPQQPSKPQVELADKSITALAATAGEIWAIGDHQSIWHRDAAGQWHQVTSVDDLQLNCILPIPGAVLVGTSEAHLLRIANGSIDRINCFDQVKEREQWYTPWGGPPDVRSMAAGPAGELYVNVHVGGILRSLDQGKSWQPTIDFHADVHEVRTVPDRPGWVVAATAEGLAVSSDQGNSWSFDQANLHATYARAVAVSGTTLLMTVSIGPRGGRAAIYRRPLDQPGAFEKCTQGLPAWFSDNINTGTLSALGKLTVFGTRDGQIFLSDDAGLTWQQTAADLTPIHCLNLGLGLG
ncbi:hypothetical protein HJG54_32130 [Leptolyngbya sp. NK1-12]|uniref:Exo-alpha-sialidase n=1 Tax=Leptolyngbya sp. NK1-12 TaxID=2547451 RepID=A0AA97AJ91_9CYAN|nr:hypothetical protein [Leptolyngbya sp. NK1-12]WNZ27525.1 hypothetical protein HJG54_32130 [Leptolyngbya sp. NK1-12]